MLHTIDDNGNIAWHCHTPTCSYHNCQGWDREIQCVHHGETQRAQNAGKTHTAHLSDPAIKWVSENEVELPICPECGNKMTLLVHRDVAEPVIAKDEQTGKILQVTMPPGKEHHGSLWIKDVDLVKKRVPHPTLMHLTPDQIAQLQEYNRAIAPNMPVDWMMSEMVTEDIHSVYPHPAVQRHQSLANQMIAAGKAYQPIENTPVLDNPSSPTQPTIDEYPTLPPIRLP